MYQQKDKEIRLLIASSWTGGHIFPGISICQQLRRIEKVEVFFVINRRSPAEEILRKQGYTVFILKIEGIKGKGIKSLLCFSKIPIYFYHSFKLIKKISPSFILGLGGSVCGPICILGKILGIPTAIHEQNLIPGLTNRILSYFVDNVFVSFEETKKYLRNAYYTGNPVREEFFCINRKKGEKFRILVTGGSQGAHAINAVFLDALRLLDLDKIKIIHQTGEKDFFYVKKRYEDMKIDAEVLPFIEDMPAVLEKVDLVISRSGASTLFELSASGTPSILIPYPYSSDRHQEKNALALVKKGGAEMILQDELTAERLAAVIKKYMKQPERLKEMGKKAKMLAKKDSALLISEKILEMLKHGNT